MNVGGHWIIVLVTMSRGKVDPGIVRLLTPNRSAWICGAIGMGTGTGTGKCHNVPGRERGEVPGK